MYIIYLFIYWNIIASQCVLVSAVQQRESAIGIHISPPSWTFLPPHPTHLGHQSTELSSLCYIAGPH